VSYTSPSSRKRKKKQVSDKMTLFNHSALNLRQQQQKYVLFGSSSPKCDRLTNLLGLAVVSEL
jgi:hypothetical protein